MEDPPHVSLTFPPHPVWVRAAREAVRTLLVVSPRPELADTAVLLTSEAVTNAINACADKGCTTSVTTVSASSSTTGPRACPPSAPRPPTRSTAAACT
ncbi:hypothetical protein ACFU3O_22840 [Streptomyces antibioticus]|uniref:hypothetical protein n=1 Tax=Streptomyces antibioticus TaxID=1890 RepID=UPI0036820CA1